MGTAECVFGTTFGKFSDLGTVFGKIFPKTFYDPKKSGEIVPKLRNA
jgi:hypothetical protein